jgi:hypothetical protein
MPSDEEVITRAGSLRAMTELTDDGQPHPVRRYRTYDTWPLPIITDNLLCMLTYLKQNPIQEVQGQLLGMSQLNTHKWIHRLHTVLHQA